MTFWKTSTRRSTLPEPETPGEQNPKTASASTKKGQGPERPALSESTPAPLPGSVGQVETQFFEFDGLPLENGAILTPVTLAYETYGTLNTDKSNAILCCHALSGDAHAAGRHAGAKGTGWWEQFIGPGKAFDTDRFFVICSNVIGSCSGSTGPRSLDPKTGEPYGLDFPFVTIKDMVAAQARLLDYLGIEKLFCAAGGSMGGMQALQWSVSFPHRVQTVVAMASTARHSSQQIAFNEVGRQAIMSDPNWRQGAYYGHSVPASGLALARMVGHITYLSEQALQSKFSRRLQDKEAFDFHFDTEFQVESYLRYQGDKFVERFDANSYLYITRALDYFDLADGFASLAHAFKTARAKYLLIAFNSDWLYPAWQSKELARAAKSAGRNAAYFEIDTPYGHDAFLLPNDAQTSAIRNFLFAEAQQQAQTQIERANGER